MSQERIDLILIMLTLKFEGSEPSSDLISYEKLI